MTAPRPELVVVGEVLVAAEPGAVERAGAIGVAGGRVVRIGSRADVLDNAAPGAEVIDAAGSAVVPGLHDFHLHLVGLARTRIGVVLDEVRDGAELLDRVRRYAGAVPGGGWVTGRGWSEATLAGAVADGALEEAVGGRPAILGSHDGHSAWASAAALDLAGIGAATADPSGGRIERNASGAPTGVLRESALDLLDEVEPLAQGPELRDALDATLRELAGHGITGATDAGDYTDRGGVGADAALGDSYSSLTDLADLVDGRLRLTLDIPADALAAAAAHGLRTGAPLDGRRTMRFGWAKEYADGALGSGTAALFEPASCGDRSTGIMRVGNAELDALFGLARPAGIGMAIHAIGDRAAAAVLDAVERAGAPAAGTPRDRLEHAQLMRGVDRLRLASLGVTASVQPIHAAADRDLVEACWRGRGHDAYAWRSLLDSGALLAAGSDAPVESVNPWLGVFAAVHRRLPSDARDDWRPEQALTVVEALHAYTLAPALAMGAVDEGHLRLGARADLAVLDVGLDELLAGDLRHGQIRSTVTLVDGSVASA